METKNAVIKGYHLRIEREWAVTFSLALDYGDSSCQGFGGSILFNLYNEQGGDHGGQFIGRILQVVGVDDAKALVGKAVRVEATHDKVHRIGHITEDRWFCPETDIPWKGGY